MYYVYKITNKTNGKFYIGKRKHADPYTDSYMGSGKLIKSAIEKYGRDNFIKEIIDVFKSNDEAALLEYSLVTKEVVESKQSYNLHEGGHGGFAHINNVPPEERLNIKSLRVKIEQGLISIGGTQHWDVSSYNRVRAQGQRNRDAGLTSGWKHTEEWKLEKSKESSGENNSQYGSVVCINLDTGEKKRFKVVPDGWISSKALKEQQMSESRRWYNDGDKNFYVYLTDSRISELKLSGGRI